MTQQDKLDALEELLRGFYETQGDDLLYHGWHHIVFVRKKARVFAESIGCDTFLVESAALVHDLSHVVRRESDVQEGKPLREGLLGECDYGNAEIMRIECIVEEALSFERNKSISKEAKALSDADALYRVLPFTPILFSRSYLKRSGNNIKQLAKNIVERQIPLFKNNTYFYTDFAKEQYMPWAKGNLRVWQYVHESFEDPDVAEVLALAKKAKVL